MEEAESGSHSKTWQTTRETLVLSIHMPRIINNRLLTCAKAEGVFSDLQYGFWKERSTVDAIQQWAKYGDLAPRNTA